MKVFTPLFQIWFVGFLSANFSNRMSKNFSFDVSDKNKISTIAEQPIGNWTSLLQKRLGLRK